MEYTILVLTFIAVFILLASGLILLFYRGNLGRRLSGVLSRTDGSAAMANGGRFKLDWAAESIGAAAASIRKTPITENAAKGTSGLQQRLATAGYRNDSAVNVFWAFKVIVPALLVIGAFVSGAYRWNPFIVLAATAAIGYLVPDFWLDNRIEARRDAIRRGLPDLLDLLVVCLEAGLSLDQAALRSSEEMRFGHPVIADEISLVILEVRAGQPRLNAWRNLAQRTGVDSVQMLVATLVQSDQFGTGVSKNLRTLAETLRTRARQQVEEQTAKTSVKLIFPLVLFIFPSFFIVLLGPAGILLVDTFSKK